MSSTPVVIDFIVKNIPEINRALRSVSQAMAAQEREQARNAQRAAAQNQKLADQEAKGKVNAWRKADAEIKSIQDKAYKDVERQASAKSRVEQRAAQEKVRIMQRTDNEVRRIQEQSQRESVRSFERSEAQKNASAAKWLRTREREQERSAAATAASGRRFASAAIGGAASGARLIGRTAMGLAGTVAQLGGGFSIADSVAQRGELERSAVLLGNSAIGVNGVTAKDADPKKLMDKAKAASISTGIDANDLVKATRSYVAQSSDFKGGVENMDFFGKVSKATGTSVGEVGDYAKRY